jgi:hypothetical protein
MGVMPSFVQPPTAIDTTQLPRRIGTTIVPGQLYFIPVSLWLVIGIAASVVPLSLIGAYEQDSLWVGVGIALAVVVVLHTGFAVRTVPWVPGLILMVALLQWVLGPWAGYHVPPYLPTYAMAVPASDYFSYAVPATLLLAIGLYLPLWRLGRRTVARIAPTVPVDFVHTCDIMIVVGSVASVIQVFPMPLTLQYAMLLVGYVSFVGAFGLLLARSTGWGWRLAAVLGLRAVLTSSDGMFHDLLLWTAYTVALLGFVFRWRVRTLVVLAVGAVLVMGMLNEMKLAYRLELGESPEMPLTGRAELMASAMQSQIDRPLAAFSEPGLSHTVTRVNQGWIIARILYWVPTREPFARGETLWAAVRAAVLPRVLDPGKYLAGGFWYFERFTGMSMRQVSMNLSVAGEMYANFGRQGGLIGVLLFGIVLGLVYRVFARWGVENPLWWAWAPYVMLYTMQAENGIGEAVNHVVKSFVVMIAFMSVVPAWQTLRRWHLRRPFARVAGS